MGEVKEEKGDKESVKVRNRRVHLANERTFLAWIRTSISVMAFGFVVERFSLFVRQMAVYLGKAAPVQTPYSYSAIIGILLVTIGTLMALLAFLRFRTVERQIDEDTYASSPLLDTLLTLAVLAIGSFLILYLYHSM